MPADVAGLLGALGAGLGVVTTVVYAVFKWKELRTLWEIRNRMAKPGSK